MCSSFEFFFLDKFSEIGFPISAANQQSGFITVTFVPFFSPNYKVPNHLIHFCVFDSRGFFFFFQISTSFMPTPVDYPPHHVSVYPLAFSSSAYGCVCELKKPLSRLLHTPSQLIPVSTHIPARSGEWFCDSHSQSSGLL